MVTVCAHPGLNIKKNMHVARTEQRFYPRVLRLLTFIRGLRFDTGSAHFVYIVSSLMRIELDIIHR